MDMEMDRNYDNQYKPCYRSRSGMIFGVFKGISERFYVSLFWLRALGVATLIITGFFPVGIIYIVAGLLMKAEPIRPILNDEDAEFYTTYTTSKKLALSRLNRQFKSLEQRIRRMEALVTDKEFAWEQRLRSGN